MSNKSFNMFLMQEGLRQDAQIHSIATQLSTKAALYMVFAAFVFNAESTLASIGGRFGLLPKWGWGGSMLLALTAIATLLRCVWLERYEMPPVLPELRRQADQFFKFDDIKDLPEEDQMARFQGKFVNSLATSLGKNFNVNARIASNLKCASILIGASVACLFVSLLWVLRESLVTFFSNL